jgi:hypothetical protein
MDGVAHFPGSGLGGADHSGRYNGRNPFAGTHDQVITVTPSLFVQISAMGMLTLFFKEV